MPRYRRIPPRRPPSGRRFLSTWSALAAAVALALLLVAWSERLPAARTADAPATEFAAARAWPVLAHLADSVGTRPTGTTGAARALADLERRMRALPGWEVVVQDTVGVRPGRAGAPTVYHTRNLLARLPGESPEAVLLSAHYDTPIGSPGAADDGVAAAALVEVARALAERRRAGAFRNTVIVNLNGAEEQGLLGAEGFALHPWAADVRAFVDLESAGTDGKAVLFQTGPGHHWLTRAYAAAAPMPYGSVIGQDIFQSGWVPSRTDFEVYARTLRAPGLDVALYRGGWKYHTPLDALAAIAPGTVQHLGENALAVADRLARTELPRGADTRRSVYYDVLGLTMVAHDHGTARLVAIVAAVLALLAVLVVIWRHGLPPSHLFAALGLTLGGVVLALLLPVALAWLVGGPLGRPHGWFAHPGRGVAAFGLLALAGLLVPQWAFARRIRSREIEPAARTAAAAAAALLVALVPLAAATSLGVGAGYLFAWAVIGGAIGLLSGGTGEGARAQVVLLVATFPAMVLVAQTTTLLVALFAPVSGRFPLPVPFDVVIAAITAAGVVTALLVPVALAQRAERAGAALSLALVGGVLLLAWTALTFPYTPERPQRVTVVHTEDATGRASLRLTGTDYVGIGRAVRAALPSDTLDERLLRDSNVVVRPAPAVPFAGVPPRVVRATRLPEGGRLLTVRVTLDGAVRARLRVTGGEIVEVNGARLEPTGAVQLVGEPADGWLVQVRGDADAPIAAEVAAVHAVTTVAARELMTRLPAWTAPYAATQTVTRAEF